MRALIIDSGLDRGSLAAARALKADGWTVGVGSPFRGLAGSSRMVSRWHAVPDPSEGADALIAAVRRAVASGSYEVVFSSDDAGVIALSSRRDEIDAVVPYAQHQAVLAGFDKLELTRRAERVGIEVPRTLEATEEALSSWRGPVVVKPSLTFADDADGRLDTVVLDTPEDAPQHVREILRAGARPLLQEVVSGPLIAFNALADRDGTVVARSQQRAELTWPPRVGVSARAHTTAVDVRLAGRVEQLLADLGWFGLAQLQFIVGPDGGPRLLDFNGRFYGSLTLSVAAGVSFPALWARLATGRALPAVPQARPGQRYQWFSRDLRASLASPGPSTRAVLDTAVHAVGASHSVWRSDDPWPAVRHYGGSLVEKGLEWAHLR